MYKISDEVIKFIAETMKNWQWNWQQEEKSIAEMKIQRGIL